MKTIKEAKARMRVGTKLLCVENTYRPELNGTHRIITRMGVTRWQWLPATGIVDPRPSWSDWPSGIKIIDADTIRIPLGRMRDDATVHTLTLRFVDEGSRPLWV